MSWNGIPELCGNSIFRVIYEMEIGPQTENKFMVTKGEEGEG